MDKGELGRMLESVDVVLDKFGGVRVNGKVAALNRLLKYLLTIGKSGTFDGHLPLGGLKKVACKPFYAVELLPRALSKQYFSSLLRS